jgi:hypothetical protein
MVADTLIRQYTRPTGFDFWAWEAARDLINDDPHEAWLLILELVGKAPDSQVLGTVAAGELEEFIHAHAGAFIDRIEVEARRNGRLKEALAYVWISGLQPELFDRVERAAGVPLRRV